MTKVNNGPIPNLTEDWGRASSDGLPYSGESVQKFIKGQLSELGDKVGDAYFDSATNN